MKRDDEYCELASFRFETGKGKTFFFDVKENVFGLFLKITESRHSDEGYIRSSIMVSEDVMNEFSEKLDEVKSYLCERKEA